ncbi:uncharacterized protein TNCV_3344091 [Trichonephila clavipes]|nr:uncharacterized protein TNCV_3344091 [Trichonephila clavipes]
MLQLFQNHHIVELPLLNGHVVLEAAMPNGHAVVEAGMPNGHAVVEGAMPNGHVVVEAGMANGHAVGEAAMANGHAVVEAAMVNGHAVGEAAMANGHAVVEAAMPNGHAVVEAGMLNGHAVVKSLHDKGYSFPPNPSDVMKLVYKQYNVIKARVTNEISSKLNAGLRCSLTIDEFTSLKNRRYLNINVHFNVVEIFNLGMLRTSGFFSAENCVKAAETKLQEFGITTEKHIVACVTHGASMMVKFGKIRSCEYHLCYAHAIHLAVCDVLYNKQIDLVENTVEVEDKSHEEEDNDESEVLVEDLDKALDLEFESGVGTDALFHVTYAEKNSIT